MANRYTKDIISGADTLSASFKFKVLFNHVITFGFQSVSGIRVSRNVDFFPEGGVNDHYIMAGLPQTDTPELTFSRGLILKAPQIVTTAAKAAAAQIPNNAARKAAFIALNTVDPQEMLENGPAYGEIEVYSTTEKGKKIGAYSFLALGIKEWSLSDLSGTDSSPLIENFSVIHTGLRRLPLSPPLGQYYFHTENNNYSGPQERTPVEGDLMQKNRETIEEMAKSKRNSSDSGNDSSLTDANKEVAKQMAENNKVSSDISNQLQEMKEKMAQEYSDYQADLEKYEQDRQEGKQKSEELKEHARQKAEKYKKWAEDLTDKIIKAEGKNLKSIEKRAKELSQIANQASEIAQRSLNALAIKLSDFREKQKQKAEDLKEKTAEMEKAKNAAIQASVLARQMADSVRENSRKLQSGTWEKIKEQNEQEIAKVQGQSTVSNKGKDNKQSEGSNEQKSNESQNKSPEQKENQASEESNKENTQNTQESQSKSSQQDETQADKSTSNEDSQNKSSQPDNDNENEQKKAKSWDEIKEQNLKEMQKLQDEFNKLRQQGSEEAQKKAEEVKELLEKNQKQVEEIEKKKQEFEQKKEEFKKMSKNISDDAEETSAEAENSADEVDAMIENAA